MTFEHEKQIQLGKKGDIDKHIFELVEIINSKTNYYTTSSCSGRIMLLARPNNGKKIDSEWVYTTHEPATAECVWQAMQKLTDKPVWFVYEPLILHICCRDIEDASKLLDITKDTGLKHSGIYSVKNKIIVEIKSHDKIFAPVAENGKVIVSEDYASLLVEYANERMEKNKKNIELLLRKIRSL